MPVKLPPIFAASLLFAAPLFSDQPQQENTPIIYREVENNASFKVEAEYEHLARAKFYKPESQKHNHLSISSENAIALYKHALSEKTGFNLGVGYLGVHFDFARRKLFDQKQFNNALFNIGAYTKEIDRWKWKADLLTQINTDHFTLSRYSFFTGLLKGKYAWHKNRNLHVGILAYTGLRYSRALPVVGFDYTFNEQWKLNCVYPLNMNLLHIINKNWSVEAGIRYYLTRQRLKEDDKVDRGFVAFRNWSAEIGVNWVYNNMIELNAHIGESLGNRMRISNRNDRHRKHYRMHMAPGFGFVASVKL